MWGLRRLAQLWRGRQAKHEIDEELESHLALATDEFERQGLDRTEARRRAVLQLGGVEQVRESLWDGLGWRWWENLARDARLGLRTLGRSRGFTFTVVAMMAVSIGATASLYSVVSATILHPLPYADAGRLVSLQEQRPGREMSPWVSTRLLRSLHGVETKMESAGMIGRDVNVSGEGLEAERVMCVVTGAPLFRVLGVRPQLGRLLLERDDERGAERVVVASHAYWRLRLGGRSDAIGRPLTVDGEARTLIGVLPAEFRLAGMEATRSEIYIPGLLDETRWKPPMVIAAAVGRLKPGGSPEQARAEFQAVANANPPRRGGVSRVGVAYWEEELAREARPPLAILSAVAAILLVVACVNAANLQLARGMRRQREFAVRRALGAGGGRIASQLLVESTLLALAGACGGWALAYAGKDLLSAFLVQRLPEMPPVAMNWTVLGFALATGVAAGLLFGLWPAWSAVRSGLNDPMKEGARSSGGRAVRRFRNALVAMEVGLSLAGMVAAGLLLRSVLQLEGVEGGYRREDVTVGTVDLDRSRYTTPEQQGEFVAKVLDEVRRMPGVGEVGVSSHMPLGGLIWTMSDLEMEGRAQPIPMTVAGVVSPGYFRAIGIPLQAGRGFEARDVRGAEEVALVDRRFAELYCREQGCVGRRFRHWSDDGRMVRIVGQVGDVRLSPSSDREPTIYRPFAQEGMYHLEFVARGAAGDVGKQMAEAARRADWTQPMHSIEPMEARRARNLAPKRVMLTLVGVLGLLALGLGAAGAASVLWHDVSQERRAIGIRLALGARTSMIVKREMLRGMTMVGAGAVAGSLWALLLAEWMKSELWGIQTGDAIAWLAAWGTVLAAGVAACAIPAWLGSRVEVAEVLRME